MPFLKRLGFYSVGLFIGIVFLVFFFTKKSEKTGVELCYLPNCRVLKDLRSKPLSYSDKVSQLVQEQKLDSLDIVYFLNEGDIDFKKSDTKSKPCKTYRIEAVLKDKDAVLRVRSCEERVIIENIEF